MVAEAREKKKQGRRSRRWGRVKGFSVAEDRGGGSLIKRDLARRSRQKRTIPRRGGGAGAFSLLQQLNRVWGSLCGGGGGGVGGGGG